MHIGSPEGQSRWSESACTVRGHSRQRLVLKAAAGCRGEVSVNSWGCLSPCRAFYPPCGLSLPPPGHLGMGWRGWSSHGSRFPLLSVNTQEQPSDVEGKLCTSWSCSSQSLVGPPHGLGPDEAGVGTQEWREDHICTQVTGMLYPCNFDEEPSPGYELLMPLPW